MAAKCPIVCKCRVFITNSHQCSLCPSMTIRWPIHFSSIAKVSPFCFPLLEITIKCIIKFYFFNHFGISRYSHFTKICKLQHRSLLKLLFIAQAEWSCVGHNSSEKLSYMSPLAYIISGEQVTEPWILRLERNPRLPLHLNASSPPTKCALQ